MRLSIQKIKIMASGPITSWQIGGEAMEIVTDFILGGCKITTDGDCSHEIKRRLLLGRKAMTNLESILKRRDVSLTTKVRLVKTMVFPVVMCGCESWTIKKAEHRRIWCFWTVVLEKTLESPLDCEEIQPVHSKGDQSWVFFRRSDVEAETPILWPPDAKNWLIFRIRPWCWEKLRVGGKQNNRGWDDWMASLTQWTWVCANPGRYDREAGHAAIHGIVKSWTWLRGWRTTGPMRT